MLDVNDNAPQTSKPTYFANVLENSAADTPIVQITATDLDHGGGSDNGGRGYRGRRQQQQQQPPLRFQILKGNPQNFFSLDERTGLLTTTDRKLDREVQVNSRCIQDPHLHIADLSTDPDLVPKITYNELSLCILITCVEIVP